MSSQPNQEIQELTIFDALEENGVEQYFEPVANPVDVRQKHLAQAAIWLLKSKGEQTVKIFMSIDPDNPPAQSVINQELVLQGSLAVASANRVKAGKIDKAKKEFAAAVRKEEIIKAGFISRAAWGRVFNSMWQRFETGFDMYFSQLAESKKELEDKEQEVRDRFPTFLQVWNNRMMTEQPQFQMPPAVQAELAENPPADEPEVDPEVIEVSKRVFRGSSQEAIRLRLSDSEIRAALQRESERLSDNYKNTQDARRARHEESQRQKPVQ